MKAAPKAMRLANGQQTRRIPMRAVTRPIAAALSLACMLLFAAVLPTANALAAQPEQAEETLKQIPLSDKQIEGVIAAKPDIDAIMAKVPQDTEKPDPKVMAQLDGAAKKHGFANYNEYETVILNINLVLDGFDPDAKKYVGSEAMLKKQIEEVKADKQMSPKDKKEALDELNEALKSVTPLQVPGNVQVVTKFYDKLAPLMPQDQ
jgi:hypothetical protein